VPIANVAKVNAVFTDLSRNAGKEAEKELRFVGWIARRRGLLRIGLPGFKRSYPESGMNREVVNASDLEREPAFEFGSVNEARSSEA
jgi:hypothetical protein